MAYKTIEDVRLYRCYSEQKYRCNNKNKSNYDRYGGRGIKFLFKSFKQWKAVLGPKPSDIYSVDRINNDGHYEPGNVRWATPEEQSLNKGIYKNNPFGIKGVSYSKQNKKYISQYKKEVLYRGTDFFEACCARKSAELRMP